MSLPVAFIWRAGDVERGALKKRSAGDVSGHEFHGNQWTAVSAEERAIAEKLGLPTSYSGTDSSKLPGQAVDNPLPQSKQLDYEQTKRLPIMMMGKTKEVDISSLKSTQDYVQPSAVEHFKDGSYMKHQPIVATIHGDEVLLNGNHNVLAAKLRGEKTISVQHLGDFSKHADYIKEVDKGGHRMASRHPETLLHKAADAHVAKLSVAVRYAFALGRKAYKSGGVDAAVAAVRTALADVLPKALLGALAAGGEAGSLMLEAKLRAAGDVEGHPFHGNQWTGGGGHEQLAKFPEVPGSPGIIDITHPSVFRENTEVPPWGPRDVTYSKDVTTVNLDNLVAMNTEASSKAIAHQIDHPSDVPIEVVRWRGKEYIDDGTHRVIAAKLRGEKTIKAVVGRVTGPLNLSMRAAKDVSTPLVKRVGPLAFRFDASNPAAVAWATEHSAKLVTDISATTEQDIRDAVTRAIEGDGIEAGYDDILAAVGDETRAELIARTEVMMAANEGQRQAWDQAVDDGLLTGTEQRVWIATEGACPECDDLDGEQTALDGEYSGDGGDGPPLHPNCRCTEGIV